MQAFHASEFFDTPRDGSELLAGVQVRTIVLQPGLTVSLETFDVAQDLCAVMEEESAQVHFNCLLDGQTRICYDGQHFALDRYHVLAAFAPGKRFQLGCCAGCCNIELRIAPHLLCQLAGPQECERVRFSSGNDFWLSRSSNNLRIRDAAERLGRLLAQACVPPSLLVHACALEFLAWHLQSLQRESCCDGIPARECKQLLAAREYLLADLSQPPTIAQLARETGLNQLKIKQGFKRLFGTSVYALFQRERMERARYLLRRHGVTETATRVGYSNVSHFSSAFRKQFGILPSELRRTERV